MGRVLAPPELQEAQGQFVYRIAITNEERAAAVSVMRAVFVEELGYLEMESDEFDVSATFCVAYSADRAIACLRMIKDGPAGLPLDRRIDLSSVRDNGHHLAEISRLACLKEHRDQRVVMAGLGVLNSMARTAGVTRLVIEAFPHMAPFYERFGFAAHGQPFFDHTSVRDGESDAEPNAVLMTIDLDALQRS